MIGCESSLKRMPRDMTGVDFWGGMLIMNTPSIYIYSAPRGGSVVAELTFRSEFLIKPLMPRRSMGTQGQVRISPARETCLMLQALEDVLSGGH